MSDQVGNQNVGFLMTRLNHWFCHAVAQMPLDLCHEKTCCIMRGKSVFGFPTRSDTNQAVQPRDTVRGSKFQIKEVHVDGLYYLCRENKGTDRLCCYRAADLHLCFRICEKLYSQDTAHSAMIETFMIFQLVFGELCPVTMETKKTQTKSRMLRDQKKR